GTRSFEGRFYEIEQARIYTLPEPPPPIYVAAFGKRSASLAGRFGDGLISTAPSREVVQAFTHASGSRKPRYAQLKVCWAETEEQARDTVMRYWPTSGLPGV